MNTIKNLTNEELVNANGGYYPPNPTGDGGNGDLGDMLKDLLICW